MAEIGLEDGKALKALDSVKKYLDTPYGLVLQNPRLQDTILSTEKFQHIHRDTKKMPVYSATTMHG